MDGQFTVLKLGELFGFTVMKLSPEAGTGLAVTWRKGCALYALDRRQVP